MINLAKPLAVGARTNQPLCARAGQVCRRQEPIKLTWGRRAQRTIVCGRARLFVRSVSGVGRRQAAAARACCAELIHLGSKWRQERVCCAGAPGGGGGGGGERFSGKTPNGRRVACARAPPKRVEPRRRPNRAAASRARRTRAHNATDDGAEARAREPTPRHTARPDQIRCGRRLAARAPPWPCAPLWRRRRRTTATRARGAAHWDARALSPARPPTRRMTHRPGRQRQLTNQRLAGPPTDTRARDPLISRTRADPGPN